MSPGKTPPVAFEKLRRPGSRSTITQRGKSGVWLRVLGVGLAVAGGLAGFAVYRLETAPAPFNRAYLDSVDAADRLVTQHRPHVGLLVPALRSLSVAGLRHRHLLTRPSVFLIALGLALALIGGYVGLLSVVVGLVFWLRRRAQIGGQGVDESGGAGARGGE